MHGNTLKLVKPHQIHILKLRINTWVALLS